MDGHDCQSNSRTLQTTQPACGMDYTLFAVLSYTYALCEEEHGWIEMLLQILLKGKLHRGRLVLQSVLFHTITTSLFRGMQFKMLAQRML